MRTNIEVLVLHEGTDLPEYKSAGAAALDFQALRDEVIPPNGVLTVGTGLAINIQDPSLCLMIMPRSSMGLVGISLANTIGLIDSDYQGEIKLLVKNNNPSTEFHIRRGDRLAQGVFVNIEQVTLREVDHFEKRTQRGSGGFGSTGV